MTPFPSRAPAAPLARALARTEPRLLGAVAALAGAGVLNLASVADRHDALLARAHWLQLGWLALGALVGAALAAVDYHRLLRWSYALYATGLAALVATLVAGAEVRGARRWLRAGALALQPSELVVVALVLALARVESRAERPGGRALRDLLAPGLLVAAPAVLVARQPDLGTAVILALVGASVLALAPVRRATAWALAAAAVASVPLVWHHALHSYQRARVLAFLDADAHRLGAGWQTTQALVAVGSGGAVGRGHARGLYDPRWLPDAATDLPLSVWGNEHGFVGVAAVLAMYLVVVACGVRIAAQARDRAGAALAAGATAAVFWHVALNAGMTLGVLPVVGVTLPLFSYGGSSAVATLASVGLLVNVAARSRDPGAFATGPRGPCARPRPTRPR